MSLQSKRQLNIKTISKNKKPTADEIAEMAMSGKDISSFFSNKGQIKPPIQKMSIDFSIDILIELDEFAKELNISREVVSKPYFDKRWISII